MVNFMSATHVEFLFKRCPLALPVTLDATRQMPHGASRSVKAMSAWSVKARRAPSQHCWDARVYGHKTTAMYDNDYTPLHPPARSVPAASVGTLRRTRMMTNRTS